MRKTIQNYVLSRMPRYLLTFILAGWLSIQALSAQSVEEVLPPDVRALVGMKLAPVRVEEKDIKRAPWAKPLSPDYVQMAPARIPNFISMGSSGGGGLGLGFEEGVVAGKWPVFIVERIGADMSREILDALMLPKDLIDWHFADGNSGNISDHFIFIKGRFSLSERCRSSEEDERIIVGLIKQEKGKETCSHFSKQVKLAWMIDRQSGKITPMPTQGLQCFYLTMDDCF